MSYTKEEFLRQMAEEQKFYDHSLKARVLKYDSYLLSRYLYHLRMVEWYELSPPICCEKLLQVGINTECESMVA